MQSFTTAQLNSCIKVFALQFDRTQSAVRRELAGYLEEIMGRQTEIDLGDRAERFDDGLDRPTAEGGAARIVPVRP